MPAYARSDDPLTSHEAAASLSEPHITTQMIRILHVFQMNGQLNDEQLVKLYHAQYGDEHSRQSICSRRCDLVKLGKLRDTGERSKFRSGRYGMIHDLKERADNGHPQKAS